MRPICHQCQKPLKACICSLTQAINNRIDVLVLQHPSEVGHPKGTEKLLSLCFTQSRTVVGELFDSQLLGINPCNSVLLYPNESELTGQNANMAMQHNAIVAQKTLIVIDGTWRKSRKILYLNPWLLSLPRCALDDITPRYHVRKKERENQLSTFESAAHALALLGGIDTLQLESAVDIFDKFNLHLTHFHNN